MKPQTEEQYKMWIEKKFQSIHDLEVVFKNYH